MCEPRENRLLAPSWMLEPLHGPSRPLDGVVGVLQQGAGPGPLRGGEDRRPARLFVLHPPPDTCPVGGPCAVGPVGHTGAEPLPPRPPAPAFARACALPQGVALRASRVADRRRDRHPCGRPLMDCMAETDAAACARDQRPPPARRAGKAIGPEAAAPLRRLLLERCLWKRSLGLGKGRWTGGRRVTPGPEQPAPDTGGPRALGGETTAGLLSRQAIHRERPPTPRQPWHQTLAATGPDETREGQRGHRREPRPECPPEAPLGGQEGRARALGAYLARAPDAVRQHGAHRFTRRALEPPDGEPTHPETAIRRVAGAPPPRASFEGEVFIRC